MDVHWHGKKVTRRLPARNPSLFELFADGDGFA